MDATQLNTHTQRCTRMNGIDPFKHLRLLLRRSHSMTVSALVRCITIGHVFSFLSSIVYTNVYAVRPSHDTQVKRCQTHVYHYMNGALAILLNRNNIITHFAAYVNHSRHSQRKKKNTKNWVKNRFAYVFGFGSI